MNRLKKVSLFFVIGLLASCGETKTDSPTQTSPTEKTTSAAKTTDKKKTTKQYASNKFYNSPKFGFKIMQPDNWDLMENQMPSVPIIFVNRAKGSFSSGAESISVAVEPLAGASLDGYYNLSRQQLTTQGKVSDIVEESAGTSANNYPFKRIIYNRISNQHQMTVASFLFYHNDKGYVVSCSATTARFRQMRPLFEEYAGSIKF